MLLVGFSSPYSGTTYRTIKMSMGADILVQFSFNSTVHSVASLPTAPRPQDQPASAQGA
jgi:hypothetical protein